MKTLKMANGKLINIKSFEISGDNYGWDIWYVDEENNQPIHNLLFENDLEDATQLNNMVRSMVENMSDEKRIRFTFTQNV